MTPAHEALKPCPFCGGPVKLEQAHEQESRYEGRRQFWGVVCRNTKNLGGTCCMDQVPSASVNAAVARWNMRGGVSSPELPQTIDGTPSLPGVVTGGR